MTLLQPHIQTLDHLYGQVLETLTERLEQTLKQKGSAEERFRDLHLQAEHIQSCHTTLKELQKSLGNAVSHLKHLDSRLSSGTIHT